MKGREEEYPRNRKQGKRAEQVQRRKHKPEDAEQVKLLAQSRLGIDAGIGEGLRRERLAASGAVLSIGVIVGLPRAIAASEERIMVGSM